MANVDKKVQLENFRQSLAEYGGQIPAAASWREAFAHLRRFLETVKAPKGKKKVIFLDELPWFDTPKSAFLPALEHFWNDWACTQPNLLLIVCGSATSWMMKKLIKGKGGLHNRVTAKMRIEPFTLAECELYYKKNGFRWTRYQMAESYMVMGGVPFYLNLLRKEESLVQNIDRLCFHKDGALREEYDILFSSLFKHSEQHIKVVEALAKKRRGMTRNSLASKIKSNSGGGLTKILSELEDCGFIRKYQHYGTTERGFIYQLTDPYTFFYHVFLKDKSMDDPRFWSHSIDDHKRIEWSGYAFEQLCLYHIDQIKTALGISGVVTRQSAWMAKDKEDKKGAQIDLLIDRKDGVINLCEMKFYSGEYTLTKKEWTALNDRKKVFIQKTKPRKAIYLTLVTTYGLKNNEYSDYIQNTLILDDLFTLQ